jgi:hypothetical protein
MASESIDPTQEVNLLNNVIFQLALCGLAATVGPVYVLDN